MSTTPAPSPRKCCENGPTSITAGWKPSPENVKSPWNGPKRACARRTMSALTCRDGTAEFLWRLFHSEEHGGRALLPIRGAAVPSRRPRLPHHRPPALPLYSLLLLYPGRGVGSPFFVRGFFPAFPDHLLPERPSLYRTGIAPPQYRLPQGR